MLLSWVKGNHMTFAHAIRQPQLDSRFCPMIRVTRCRNLFGNYIIQDFLGRKYIVCIRSMEKNITS